MRPATPAEERQLDIDSTRALIPEISDSDAVAYRAASSDFSQLVLKMEQEQGASFARAIGSRGAPFIGTLVFKNAPASTIDAIEASNSAGLIILNDAKYTKTEQLAITNRAFDAVARLKVTTGVTATYDWDKDVISISFTPKTGVNLSDITSKLSDRISLTSNIDAGMAPAPTAITYTQVDEISGAIMSGGTALSARSSAQGANPPHVCTAAFGAVGAVNSNRGRSGLLTAEHCDSALYYEGRLFLTQVVVHDGSVRGDARFVYNSEGARRDFVSSQTTSGTLVTRPALRYGANYVDQPVCTYGTTTGPKYSVGRENCDRIKSVGNPFSFCNTNGNCYQYYNQNFTERPLVEPGDSGGPWFDGNTALGITSGYVNGFISYSTFQPITDATRKTGTQVLTQ